MFAIARSATTCRRLTPGAASRCLIAFALACAASLPATSQSPQTSSQPPVSPGAVAPGTAIATPPLPSQALVVALVRSSLIALHQANATGNYTVLRDLGSPVFQVQNNAARLGQIFQSLRDNAVDLSDILVEVPQLMLAPSFDNDGRLRLVGFVPSETQRVHFDLLFQPVGGNWQIFGVSVKPVPVPKKPPPEKDEKGGSTLKPVIPEKK